MSLTITYTDPITNKTKQINNLRLRPKHLLFAKGCDGNEFNYIFSPVYDDHHDQKVRNRFKDLFGDRGELIVLDVEVSGDETYKPVDPITRLNARNQINQFLEKLEDRSGPKHRIGTVLTNPHTDETYTVGQRGRKPLWVKELIETGSVTPEPEKVAAPVKAVAAPKNDDGTPKTLWKYTNAETGETYIAGLKRGRPPAWVMALKASDYKPTQVYEMEN
jgi:hypothetical protein